MSYRAWTWKSGRSPWLALTLICTLLATLVAPLAPTGRTASAADELSDALTLINTYRAWLGLQPMRRDPALDASASGHARYYQTNFGDPNLAGMGLHTQQPGKPGFTGETMQDRARAAGYKGSVNENIGLSGSMLSSVEWFMATVGHRLTLIDPRYTDIGFGAINDGKAKIEVIAIGAPRWTDTATPEWNIWPPQGTTGVGLNFWGEAPNPFPSASYPTGYPITVKYHGPGNISFDNATISANGQTVPSFASVGNGWLTKRTYMIATNKPMQPGTAYTVTVTGSANGAAFTQTWSFRTAADSSEDLALSGQRFAARSLPSGVGSADPSVQDTWWNQDGPIYAGWEERTWLWGPDTFAARDEEYSESPDGQRKVYYFDKSRMEVTDPNADRSSAWYVTNGLLVRDMIMGAVQVGDAAFAPTRTAGFPLAGDPAEFNPNAPTYESLVNLATLRDDHKAPDQTGKPAQATLAKDGTVGEEASLGSTKLANFDATTGHNIPAIFSDWLAGQSWDWLYVLGHPITEPYWIRTNVGGTEQWVLMQAFERRLLTYTPANDPEWRIEMGNVGRHYYEWRYGTPPPE